VRIAVLGVAGVAHPIGEREQQHRHGEGEQYADHPGELRIVGFLINEHEPFEDVHRSNDGDRAEELLLELAEADIEQPLRPIGMLARIDPAHEILVARADDEQDQIGEQRDVDQL